MTYRNEVDPPMTLVTNHGFCKPKEGRDKGDPRDDQQYPKCILAYDLRVDLKVGAVEESLPPFYNTTQNQQWDYQELQ